MIILGDCLEIMKNYPDNHFSAIVTDPPYGIKFMGKKWDYQLPKVDVWSEALRICKPGSFMLAFGGTRTFHRLVCEIEDAGWEIRDCLMWLYGSGFPKSHNKFGIEGYGTALKPAWEPIIMAMKPCDGTFANNAEKWGQAGINIDECRLDAGDDKLGRTNKCHQLGRWPANLILDEEAGALIDEQSEINASRFFYCAKTSSKERNEGLDGIPLKECGIKNDSGRGFSESDPYKKIMYKNNHPTVKPIKLMEYLIKLVMPPKVGLLLDHFAGSGTTLLAAKNLGFESIGIEIDENYCEIAKERLKN